MAKVVSMIWTPKPDRPALRNSSRFVWRKLCDFSGVHMVSIAHQIPTNWEKAGISGRRGILRREIKKKRGRTDSIKTGQKGVFSRCEGSALPAELHARKDDYTKRI